jgi:type II secretory pathway pseudopilin PulG
MPMASRWTTSATFRRAAPERGISSAARGFTILELLVAMGILLAAGSILIPFTLAELERREVALAEDQLGMLIQFARVEARRTGTPIEVMIDADGRQVEVHRLDPKSPGLGFARRGEGDDADALPEASPGFDEMDPETRVLSRWARRSLPDVASLRPPPAEAEFDRETFRSDDAFGQLEPDLSSTTSSSAFERPWPGPTRFAVAFPDGSVVTVTPAILASPGRLKSWKIDPWSGRSTFTTFEIPSPEILIEDENDVAEMGLIDDPDLDVRLESAERSS